MMKFLKGFALFAMSFILVLLVACSPDAVKTEDQLKSDLQEEPSFYSVQKVTISDLQIIKRQTNASEKQDIVYVSVTVSNDKIKCNLSYQMSYVLYNQRWLLNEVTPYNKDSWTITPLVGPDQAFVDAALSNYRNGDYQYLSNKVDLDSGSAVFTYSTERVDVYLTQQHKVEVTIVFDVSSAKWVCVNENIKESVTDVEWNIIGNWEVNVDSYKYNYILSISAVSADAITLSVTSPNGKVVYFDGVVPLDGYFAAFVVPATSTVFMDPTIHIGPTSIYLRYGPDGGFISDFTRQSP